MQTTTSVFLFLSIFAGPSPFLCFDLFLCSDTFLCFDSFFYIGDFLSQQITLLILALYIYIIAFGLCCCVGRKWKSALNGHGFYFTFYFFDLFYAHSHLRNKRRFSRALVVCRRVKGNLCPLSSLFHPLFLCLCLSLPSLSFFFLSLCYSSNFLFFSLPLMFSLSLFCNHTIALLDSISD